jgi:hypothetical protein
MPPAVFEPAIPAYQRLHTHALDRAAAGIHNENTELFRKLCYKYLGGLFLLFFILKFLLEFFSPYFYKPRGTVFPSS